MTTKVGYVHKRIVFVRRKLNKRILRWHSYQKDNGRYPPEVLRLLARARRDIGYSPKTGDHDILISLYKESRSAS